MIRVLAAPQGSTVRIGAIMPWSFMKYNRSPVKGPRGWFDRIASKGAHWRDLETELYLLCFSITTFIRALMRSHHLPAEGFGRRRAGHRSGLIISALVECGMSQSPDATVAFDVLLRGETDDVTVASANLDKLRPPAEAIETCFRWLSEQGVTCHRVDFGLACEAKVELFESLFGVRLTKQQHRAPGTLPYQLSEEPESPPEIRHLVSQVTLAHPPTYFG